jgi:hypothetical protein
VNGQGSLLTNQLGRIEVVAEYYQMVGERYLRGGRPCGTHNVVAKVEEHFKDKLSQPFDLTPDLCRWVSYEF